MGHQSYREQLIVPPLVDLGPPGGVEENPLKSCLSVSRVETGTPGGGGCLSETRVLVSLSEVLVSLSEVLVSGS